MPSWTKLPKIVRRQIIQGSVDIERRAEAEMLLDQIDAIEEALDDLVKDESSKKRVTD